MAAAPRAHLCAQLLALGCLLLQDGQLSTQVVHLGSR
jgi:hypothetical protein